MTDDNNKSPDKSQEEKTVRRTRLPNGRYTELGEPARNPKPGIPLDKELVRSLIKKYRGNISKVADTIGCDRHSVKRLCDRTPDLKLELETARERYIDAVEESVWDRAIDGKDPVFALFALKTQGRSRGWAQDQPPSASDIAAAALQFVINKSSNPAEPNK